MFRHALREGIERCDEESGLLHAAQVAWNALALCVKAKLEAVEAGITTFEEEFMAHIVLPNGTTMADQALPYIEAAYHTGSMPPMLSFDA